MSIQPVISMLRHTLLLLVFLTLPLRANLGETVEQCIARYGKPSAYTEASDKLPFGTVTFTAGNFGLIVFILNNKEVGARVSKKDKSAFSDAEMKMIMTADTSATDPWTPTTSDDPTCLKWSRNDKATILYDKDKHILIFTADDMAKALNSPPPPAAPAPAK